MYNDNSIIDGDFSHVSIASNIKFWRKIKNLKQSDLADLTGMSAAQLCHIEKARNAPSVRTLRRIADALGVSMEKIAGRQVQEEYLAEEKAAKERPAPAPVRKPKPQTETSEKKEELFNGLEFVHEGVRALLPENLQDNLWKKIREYRKLEAACGASSIPAIHFTLPLICSLHSAGNLARQVRVMCGIGTAVVFDTIVFFETKGLRVITLDLPKGVDSFALYEKETRNAFIVVSKNIPDERQQFRTALEVGNIFQYVSARYKPVVDSPNSRRFSREFAAAFIMPEETVREQSLLLGLGVDWWSYDMLLQIKQRFGVSAEAFAYRLEELELISAAKRTEFIKQIREYYEAHDFSEPNPVNRRSLRHSRFSDLKLLAAALEKKDENQ